MSGTTTELNLATAVDADDNADYLTISLRNSLITLDSLFNNATGHTHTGAHQGGPVAPAAGSITGAMIQDGSIGTADLANASVTNAKLASDTARLNLLTNGGFEIWQRGTGPFTANSSYNADRWAVGLGGTDTLSVSRDGANPDASLGGTWDAICTFVLGTGAGATNLSQILRPADFPISRAVTFSVRIRTATANAVRVGIHNGSAWAYSAYHSGGGTYETLSLTATSQYGLNLQIAVFFVASCTANVDNAILVVGSQAADYAPLHPADDLARCVRYYETAGGANSELVAMMWCTSTSVGLGPVRFKTRKAVTPTVTVTGGWSLQWGAGAVAGLGSVTFTVPTVDGVSTSANGAAGSPLTVGQGSALLAGGATSLIIAEANP